jgi:hypothetical protein
MRIIQRVGGRRRWLVPTSLLACLALQACGFGHGPDFNIGFRRVALDLSYKDQALAAPPTPENTLIPQPVISSGLFVNLHPPIGKLPENPFPTVTNTCPTAGPNEHPDDPVTVFAQVPPKPGTYLQHNTGKFSLGVGAVSGTFQMPKHSVEEIKNVTKSQINDPVNGLTDVIQWDVVVPGLGGSTTTTYQTTFAGAPATSTIAQAAGLPNSHAPAGELDLVHLVIVSGDTTVDFKPDPPVTLMAFKNGTGTSWNSAGIDQRDGTSMVVEGSITKRVNVDLCGKVYDTYEVSSQEHITNLKTGLTSNTDPNDPNIYDIATQYGALTLHQHITTTITFPTDAGTTTIVSNYDQTLDSLDPFG